MAKFSTEIINIFGELNHDIEGRGKTRGIPRSASHVTPGDLVIFVYGNTSADYRLGLIVSNKRGQGVFTSTKNNLLVSIFHLNTLSPVVLGIVLTSLYKNRARASYLKITQSLKAIIGSSEYRTYKLTKMLMLHSVTIDRATMLAGLGG